MLFKDLLVLIGEGTEASSRYGLWLAGTCNATLTAVSPVVEPALPPFIGGEMPSDILSQLREDAENAARKPLATFLESAKQTGVTVETVMPDIATRDVGGEISHLARYFDATILQQPDPEGANTSAVIEAVLFGSGRPVLIVPYIPVSPQLRTVLVAWDGGRPAARAVRDALSLLVIAERVEIVTVNDGPSSRSSARDDLARHLTRHGISADTKSLLAESDEDVANILLSYGADTGVDLIVMGGYGHSRLREFVFGGTTRTILKTMTFPVLMAH